MFNDSSWTDKKTPLWFIMLPTGHEGPYSLETLERRIEEKKLRQDAQVWREGLPVAVSLSDVLNELSAPPDDDEAPPPLPPIPGEEEVLLGIPVIENSPEQPLVRRAPVSLVVTGLITLLILFGFFQWMKDKESFAIRRYPKMPLETHAKILKDLRFEGFDKKIFFHEFASPDLTHIWLVTSGFQRCDVEARFSSVKDRLLTMGDEEVEFVSRGKLSQHVTELNIFEFRKGARIIPGYYEMEVKAVRCEWEGVAVSLRNLFSSPEQEYAANTRVILYPRGAEDFQLALGQLLRKKDELKKQAFGQETLFWDDLQMKLQTLHAISLQIEQHFLDFLDKGNRDFPVRFKDMTGQYTRRFGKALTEFVVANEGYFDGLRETELRPLLSRKDYEGMVRGATKQVGMESMKVIEKLQKMKRPTPGDLKTLRAEVLKSFERLKNTLTKQLLDVTADRSSSP